VYASEGLHPVQERPRENGKKKQRDEKKTKMCEAVTILCLYKESTKGHEEKRDSAGVWKKNAGIWKKQGPSWKGYVLTGQRKRLDDYIQKGARCDVYEARDRQARTQTKLTERCRHQKGNALGHDHGKVVIKTHSRTGGDSGGPRGDFEKNGKRQSATRSMYCGKRTGTRRGVARRKNKGQQKYDKGGNRKKIHGGSLKVA